MDTNIIQYLKKNSEFSIVSENARFSQKDSISPFSFVDFLKYFNLDSGDEFQYLNYYNDYIKLWYSVKQVHGDKTINSYRKEKYLEFLKDIEVNYLNDEQRRIIENLDYNNPLDLEIAIPYFVDKIKEIILKYSNKRNDVETAVGKWKIRGTNKFLVNEIKSYLINNFSNKYDVSLNSEIYKKDSKDILKNLNIEVEELYDYSNYYDDYISRNSLLDKSIHLGLSSFSEYNTNTKQNTSVERDLFLDKINSDYYLLSVFNNNYEYKLFEKTKSNNQNSYNIETLNVAISSNPEKLIEKRLIQNWFMPSNLGASKYISDDFYFENPSFELSGFSFDTRFNIDSQINEIVGDSELGEILFGNLDDETIYGITKEVLNISNLNKIQSNESNQNLDSKNYLSESLVPDISHFKNDILKLNEFSNFIKSHYIDGELANKPIPDKNLRRFYGYFSGNEYSDIESYGISRHTDSMDFWMKDVWKNEDVYPKYIQDKLNKKSRIEDLIYLNPDEHLYQWSLDVYGNEYGLIKKYKYNFYNELENIFQYELSSFEDNDLVSLDFVDLYANDFRYFISEIESEGIEYDYNLYLVDENDNFMVNSEGKFLVLSAGEVKYMTVQANDLRDIKKYPFKNCPLYDYFRVMNYAVPILETLSSTELLNIPKMDYSISSDLLYNCIPEGNINDYWDKEYTKLNMSELFFYDRGVSNKNTEREELPKYSYNYTISEKKYLKGTPYYRNLYSNEIEPLSSFFVSYGLNVSEEIHNRCLSLNVYYNFIICRTDENLYFANIGFDYETGKINNRGGLERVVNYNTPTKKTGELFFTKNYNVIIPEIEGVSFKNAPYTFLPRIYEISSDLKYKTLYEFSIDGFDYFSDVPKEIDFVEIGRPIIAYNEISNIYYLVFNSRDSYNNQYQFIHIFNVLENGAWELINTKFIHPSIMHINREYMNIAYENEVLSSYTEELSSLDLEEREIFWDLENKEIIDYPQPIKNKKYIFTLQDNVASIVYKNVYEYDLSVAEYYDLTLSSYNTNVIELMGDPFTNTVIGKELLLEIMGSSANNTAIGDSSNNTILGVLINPEILGVMGKRRKPFIGPCKINMDFQNLTEIVSTILNGNRIYKIELFINGTKKKTIRSNIINNKISIFDSTYSETFYPRNDGQLNEYLIQIDYYTIESGKYSTSFTIDIIGSILGEYFSDVDLIDIEHINTKGKNYLNLIYNTKLPSYVYKQIMEI